jgi:hypothetical protein
MEQEEGRGGIPSHLQLPFRMCLVLAQCGNVAAGALPVSPAPAVPPPALCGGAWGVGSLRLARRALIAAVSCGVAMWCNHCFVFDAHGLVCIRSSASNAAACSDGDLVVPETDAVAAGMVRWAPGARTRPVMRHMQVWHWGLALNSKVKLSNPQIHEPPKTPSRIYSSN